MKDKKRMTLILFYSALLLIPFLGMDTYRMRLLIMIGVYTLLALGLDILVGHTGLVSLGHAGFFAIGAYTTALVMMRFQMPFLIALLVGTLLATVVGFLLGVPTLRLTGTYLSIVTLGFAILIQMLIMNWDRVTNGTLGLRNIPRPEIFGITLDLNNHGMYYLMIVLLGLVTLTYHRIIHSKVGRAFKAIKEDPLAAEMMGIHLPTYKVMAFMIASGMAGLAGGFYATLVNYIDHTTFDFDVSILILSIVILGGMGTIRGMYLGAFLLIIFPEVARPLMAWRFVVYGGVLIIMMRFRPQGLLGWGDAPNPFRWKKMVKTVKEDTT